jgi:hypothetical protein
MNDGTNPENPDLLPATRGYVKCIARKINNHHHRQSVCGLATCMAIGIAGFAWIIVVVLSNTAGPIRTPEWVYWLLTAFLVTQIINLYELTKIDSNTTADSSYDKDHKTIEPWKPKKNNCCEPEEDGSYSRY